MSDILKTIMGKALGGAEQLFSKAIQEGRSKKGMIRRAGRYDRMAIRARSDKRRARLSKIADQWRKQAAEL